MTAIDWQYYTIFKALSREEKMRPWRENNDQMTQNRTREETNMMRISVSAIICKGSEGKQERRKARCRECRKIEREKEETKKRVRGRGREDETKRKRARAEETTWITLADAQDSSSRCRWCCCCFVVVVVVVHDDNAAWRPCSTPVVLTVLAAHLEHHLLLLLLLGFVSFLSFYYFVVFFLVYFEKSENANAISRGLIFLAEKKQQTSQKSTSNMVKTQPACGSVCVRVCVYLYAISIRLLSNGLIIKTVEKKNRKGKKQEQQRNGKQQPKNDIRVRRTINCSPVLFYSILEYIQLGVGAVGWNIHSHWHNSHFCANLIEFLCYVSNGQRESQGKRGKGKEGRQMRKIAGFFEFFD